MSKTMSLIIAILLLNSCASSEVEYAPASEPEAAGYTEQQIADNRYRVVFTGNDRSTMETVQNYALLRAAELTIQKDYDYFRVAERNTITIPDSGPSTSVVMSTGTRSQTDCGLLGCETSYAPDFASTEIHNVPDDSRYSSNLEIVMSNNSDGASDDRYDAREVIDNIRASI